MLKNCYLLIASVGLLLALTGQCTAIESADYTPIRVGGSVDSLHDSTVPDAEIAFKLIFNEVLAEVDISFNVKIYDNDEILIDKFKDGSLKAIFINSLRFLAMEQQTHPTGRYVIQYGPTIKQPYLVLVRSSDKSSALADLHGKRFSYSVGHSVGKRYLDVELLESGLPAVESFFSKVETVKDINTAIVDLYFNKTDVVLVPEHGYTLAVELNPQIRNNLSVLTQSDPLIYQAVALRQDFPQEVMDRFEPYILTNSTTERVKQVMKTFRITGLHRLTDDILKEVRELDRRYKMLTGVQP